VTSNLTALPVYEFERDGVRYVQVNDSFGRVRATVVRIGPTLGVLRVGGDAVWVVVSGEPLVSGVAQVIYQSQELILLRYSGNNGDSWVIRAYAGQ
jgi:hypothetical protein